MYMYKYDYSHCRNSYIRNYLRTDTLISLQNLFTTKFTSLFSSIFWNQWNGLHTALLSRNLFLWTKNCIITINMIKCGFQTFLYFTGQTKLTTCPYNVYLWSQYNEVNYTLKCNNYYYLKLYNFHQYKTFITSKILKFLKCKTILKLLLLKREMVNYNDLKSILIE